ncbi:hypothetical protein ACFQ6H_21155 [Rhodococcus sp. NPDC056506]|uniref:hypothetical protein n=1 Tax=Rhodococcus sp. NPDC056506 TaxID=3345844 RepID=UPI00366B1058
MADTKIKIDFKGEKALVAMVLKNTQAVVDKVYRSSKGSSKSVVESKLKREFGKSFEGPLVGVIAEHISNGVKPVLTT